MIFGGLGVCGGLAMSSSLAQRASEGALQLRDHDVQPRLCESKMTTYHTRTGGGYFHLQEKKKKACKLANLIDLEKCRKISS